MCVGFFRMSRFLNPRFEGFAPYLPGVQPKSGDVLRLNTNESPFPPSERALAFAAAQLPPCNRYPELRAGALREKLAKLYGLGRENYLPGNGSGELLHYAYLAFCGGRTGVAFPSVSYGLYASLAQVHGVDAYRIPLRADFTLAPEECFGLGRTLVLANPNAPTGLALSRAEIERVLEANPDQLLILDEAYAELGAESCIPLLKRHDNLLVLQTFSKARSMAGLRLGFAVGSEELIAELNAIRLSVNPANVNAAALALGLGILEDYDSVRENCRAIMENRAFLTAGLEALGFRVLPSEANFVLAATERMDAARLCRELGARGILIRHYSQAEIADYNRITVGTRAQMERLLTEIGGILARAEA